MSLWDSITSGIKSFFSGVASVFRSSQTSIIETTLPKPDQNIGDTLLNMTPVISDNKINIWDYLLSGIGSGLSGYVLAKKTTGTGTQTSTSIPAVSTKKSFADYLPLILVGIGLIILIKK